MGGKLSAHPSIGVHRRVFELPPAQVSAAENWVAFGSRDPRSAMRAASVCLVREDAAGVQTYLGYRPGDSPLGSVAFPGGSMEHEDGTDVRWFGPSLRVWARKLGILDQKMVRSYIICAIRELFEETGILLAGTDEQSVAEINDDQEWMSMRESIAGQDIGFSTFLARRGLGVRTDLLRPIAHWLSPNFALRRFDTWYFSAAVPQGQHASLLRSKGRWAAWLSAREVIGKRQSQWLGELVGQHDTVGLRLSQITTPAVELILERMAQANGAIAYLSRVRNLGLQHPNLLERDGRYLLEIVSSEDDADFTRRL
ncbi:NUDIX hydrolase [Glutamicibacter sp. MNS18]|uniref:NUDIX hydrolase n=1 Tax=Glutamicibacter sp. MNS18 TaxID=2989817 RepID=UPI0022355B35|nr:NUDIX hydrolase [Glutamicibacter sp. MNS18]MCW4463998.1 NUDIX hydrolase [Glutamicibacter sp. MNS18]